MQQLLFAKSLLIQNRININFFFIEYNSLLDYNSTLNGYYIKKRDINNYPCINNVILVIHMRN